MCGCSSLGRIFAGGAQQLSSETSDDDADIRINPEVDYRQTVDDEEKIEIPSFIKETPTPYV